MLMRALRASRRDLAQLDEAVLARRAVHELPDVRVERAEGVLHRQKAARVLHGGVDLQLVADDAGIGQQRRDLSVVVARDERRVKAVERPAIPLAPLENGQPA